MSAPAPLLSRREAILRTAYLLGGAAAASAMAGVLAGCGAEKDAPAAAAPAVTAAQREMIASVAEHIVPATDTPGARAVGVPDFIALMLARHYAAADRTAFLRGLDDVDGRARRAHARPFLDCTHDQQVAILARLDEETYRATEPAPRRAGDLREFVEPGAGESPLPPELEADTVAWVWGEPRAGAAPALSFWRTMKRLTLVGYYTSQPGATRELRYVPVPGRYDGCVPVTAASRAWAV